MVIPMAEMTRDEYLTLLRDNICVVTFTKQDGTERVMRCTLKSEYLPNIPVTEVVSEPNWGNVSPKTYRKINLQTVSVWDMDKSAWRGFNINTVKQIKQES